MQFLSKCVRIKINIFWLIVSAVVNLVQAVKAVGSFSSTALVTQGADDVVASSIDDLAPTNQVTMRPVQNGELNQAAQTTSQGLSRGANGTQSNIVAGRNIHAGFRTSQHYNKGLIGAGRNGGYGFVDAIDDFNKIIYELKPNNFKSIMQGIAQLNGYNNALGKGYKLILVLY